MLVLENSSVHSRVPSVRSAGCIALSRCCTITHVAHTSSLVGTGSSGEPARGCSFGSFSFRGPAFAEANVGGGMRYAIREYSLNRGGMFYRFPKEEGGHWSRAVI